MSAMKNVRILNDELGPSRPTLNEVQYVAPITPANEATIGGGLESGSEYSHEDEVHPL